MLPDFRYTRPSSLNQALSETMSDGAVIHAGGTDLLGCLRDGVFSASNVVSISALANLRGITHTSAGGLGIGCLTTLKEIADHPTIRDLYPGLSQAALSAASPQLRNQGTLGGNLCQRPRCWYYRGGFDCLRKGGSTCYALIGENQYHCIFGGNRCYIVHPSDVAPMLVALNAQVTIVSRTGERRIPLESFFVSPEEDVLKENILEQGELLSEVVIPPARTGMVTTYRKVRTRGAWDFALAGFAASVSAVNGRVDSARLVLSGVAPVPWRVPHAEQLLIGNVLNDDVIDRVAEFCTEGAQPLNHNSYKIELVRGLVRETLSAMA